MCMSSIGDVGKSMLGIAPRMLLGGNKKKSQVTNNYYGDQPGQGPQVAATGASPSLNPYGG